MLRLSRVALTVLALAVIVVPPAVAEEPAGPVKNVRVHVVCRPNYGGPTEVTVDPWLLLLDEGDETRWNLTITQPKKNWIVVEPKKGKPWPYVEKKHEGKDTAHAKGMVAKPKGEYTYNITVWCSDQETVIDPRVRVGS